MGENIRNKLYKLKNLAKNGYYGEAKNAEKMFNALCRKYHINDITLNDEEYSEVKTYGFTFTTKQHRKLLLQIIFMVTNNTDIYVRRYKSKGAKPKILYTKCTEAQYIEIEFLTDFYKRVYEQELELFTSAFIQKHNLYGEDKNNELTPEKHTMQEYLRMAMYESGMKDATPNKQIEGK